MNWCRGLRTTMSSRDWPYPLTVSARTMGWGLGCLTSGGRPELEALPPGLASDSSPSSRGSTGGASSAGLTFLGLGLKGDSFLTSMAL